METDQRLLTVKDYLDVKPISGDHIIPYGEDPLQFGELSLPLGNAPHPVVIIIHGGCWLSQYGLRPLGPLVTEVTQMGAAAWNLEYRRLGDAGGGWPGTFLDVAAGADHLRNIADRFRLDLNRVLVVGHSAGGHLALWLAARSKLPESSRLFNQNPLPVHGIVALAAIGDLSHSVPELPCGEAVARLLGGSPSQFPERYRHASPREMLPLAVPQIFIQGTRDPIVSLSYSQEYVRAARTSGDDIEWVVAEGAGHFELVIPGTDAWDVVKQALRNLLDR